MKLFLSIASLLITISCASKNLIRPLRDRTLMISKDGAKLYWQSCIKKTMFKKRCKEWHRDEYDLTKKEVREKLIDMGFVVRVRERL